MFLFIVLLFTLLCIFSQSRHSHALNFSLHPCSGESLCAVVNAIRPGTIPHVHESHLGYEQVRTNNQALSYSPGTVRACGKNKQTKKRP